MKALIIIGFVSAGLSSVGLQASELAPTAGESTSYNTAISSLATAHRLKHRIRIAGMTGDAEIAFINDPEALAFFRDHPLNIESINTHIASRSDINREDAASIINLSRTLFHEGFDFYQHPAVQEHTRILNNILDLLDQREEVNRAFLQGNQITTDSLIDYKQKVRENVLNYLYEHGDVPFSYIAWAEISRAALDEVIEKIQQDLADIR